MSVEILPSVGDDVLDFYEARGIYHLPLWDGFQHHVALKKLTTRDLCLEVKGVLERLPLLTYLDGADWMIVRHFIRWFTQDSDTPYHIWVDNDEETGKRIFFYESFQGHFKRFKFSSGISIPKEILRAWQTALPDEEGALDSHVHVQYENCQLGSCGKPSKHRIPVKSKGGHMNTLDVCPEHFETVKRQRQAVDEQKERRRLIRAAKNKLKMKPEKKKKNA